MRMILSERLKPGKRVKIFLSNGFKYEGIVEAVDDYFLQLKEKTGRRFFSIGAIHDVLELGGYNEQ